MADHNVKVYETKLWPGRWLYEVWVDGKLYDKMDCTKPRLTWAQCKDVASGYKEALDNYDRG